MSYELSPQTMPEQPGQDWMNEVAERNAQLDLEASELDNAYGASLEADRPAELQQLTGEKYQEAAEKYAAEHPTGA